MVSKVLPSARIVQACVEEFLPSILIFEATCFLHWACQIALLPAIYKAGLSVQERGFCLIQFCLQWQRVSTSSVLSAGSSQAAKLL
jgi:hypothetical protein